MVALCVQLVLNAILLDSLIINHLSPFCLSLDHACMHAHSLDVFVKAIITIISAHVVGLAFKQTITFNIFKHSLIIQ